MIDKVKNKVIGIIRRVKRRDFVVTTASTLGISVVFFLLTPGIASANWFTDALVSAADFVFGNMFKLAMWLLQWIAGIFTSLSGQFMDMSIRYAINGSNLRIAGVLQGWTIFRDLVNMLFIFVLLYVSIATILQLSNINTKKVLVNVILVGLFINFSFFFTGFVIDIGNSLSNTLYNAATPGNTAISGILIDRMNFVELKEATTGSDSAFSDGLGYLMNAVFYAVAGFVFVSGGFLFIIRHVSLLFVLMLSPLAFAAIVLPQTQKHWRKWLNTLLENTFVAPAYLLMIVVTLSIANTEALRSAGASPEYRVSTNNQVPLSMFDNPEFLLNFVVIMGLLVGSLTVAKAVSGSLAGTATSWAGKVTGAGTGMAYRNTIGRLSRRVSDSDTLTKMEAKGGMRGYAARAAMRVSDAGATASGDARGGLRALGLKDVGRSGGQGGFAAAQKREQKRAEDRISRAGEARVSAGDYRDVDKQLSKEFGNKDAQDAKARANKALRKGDIKGFASGTKDAFVAGARAQTKSIGETLQQGKRLATLDIKGFKAHREEGRKNQTLKAERRAALIAVKKEERADTALGSKKTKDREYYIDASGNRTLDKSKAAIEKEGEYVLHESFSDGKTYKDKDGNPTTDTSLAMRGAPQYKKEVVSEYIDKEGKYTSDASKAARNKDGTQEQLMQSYSEGTFFGKLFGTTPPQRAAVENQRRKKPELDQIKKILKVDESAEAAAPAPTPAPEPETPT